MSGFHFPAFGSPPHENPTAPCHRAQIISNWFHEYDNKFTVLQWPTQSPDLSPVEHLCDVAEQETCIMNVKPTNMQQPRYYHVTGQNL